eukprot:TRINITY_DN3879_c0_g1_i19.p1 TRINITY_DN3879_c0_g1~~TRINITY_DN3879_c0_g1_i19.p1  ORF type:complete len:571 (+),score=85.94 TRINITY_DN3879_c0_g1_i19:304-2016(+)
MVKCLTKGLLSVFERSFKATDSTQCKARKRTLISVAVFSAPSSLFMCLIYSRERLLMFTASFLCFLASVAVLVLLVGLRRTPTDKMVGSIAAVYSVAIMVGEVDTSIMNTATAWPLFVIMIDLLLMCEAPVRMTLVAVASCSLFLALLATEAGFRYGIYDFEWGAYSQENRRRAHGCENLPCATGAFRSMSAFLGKVIIFLVNFACTRSFAKAAVDERNRILASIDAANRIATSLSRFDLEAASSLLDDAAIPSDLKLAFEQILKNLRSYKPYLPQSVLPCDYTDIELCSIDEDDLSSSQSSSPSTLQSFSLAQLELCRPFEPVVASLLVANISNSMSVLQHSIDSFKQLISDFITTSSDIIVRHRGTLDLFLGDRAFANFGASRLQRGHSCACVKAANSIIASGAVLLESYRKLEEGLELNIGMGSGKLTCGDLGSENIMRFCVIGNLSLLVGALERVGRSAGVKMLCESVMHREVKHVFETRVHLQLVLHNDVEHVAYEIIQKEETSEQAEWLYELGNVNKWEGFNKTAIALLTKAPIPSLPSSYDDSDDPNVERLRQLLKEATLVCE